MKFLQISVIAIVVMVACTSKKQSPANSKLSPEQQIIEEGEHLFKINCIQCHMPAKDVAAPALAGVEQRWKDKDLLYEFVKNSQAVIKKDAYAEALFKKWKQAPMLPFPQLSNADIDAIFAYCNSVNH